MSARRFQLVAGMPQASDILEGLANAIICRYVAGDATEDELMQEAEHLRQCVAECQQIMKDMTARGIQ